MNGRSTDRGDGEENGAGATEYGFVDRGGHGPPESVSIEQNACADNPKCQVNTLRTRIAVRVRSGQRPSVRGCARIGGSLR